MRVLFLGGTGPVGLSSLPHLLAAGHEVALAHTGAHEPDAARDVEHLHGERDALVAPGGPAERWRPGGPQFSFDKQFVRDWSAGLDWDRTPPGPTIPQDVVDVTRARYTEVYAALTGVHFGMSQ